MFSDGDLKQLEARLDGFTTANPVVSSELREMLLQHRFVLIEYQRMKEEKLALQKSPLQSNRFSSETLVVTRAPNGRPFILVLVDGNYHHFLYRFTKPGFDGASQAARALESHCHNIIANLPLPAYEREHCEAVVKVYANFQALAFRFTKGYKSRETLAQFAASFNDVEPLYDFEDTKSNQGTASKIAANFRSFVDNPQCKLVVFGACHGPTHVDMIAPYQDRLLLMLGSKYDEGYKSFTSEKRQFCNVFIDEDSAQFLTKYNAMSGPARSQVFTTRLATAPQTGTTVRQRSTVTYGNPSRQPVARVSYRDSSRLAGAKATYGNSSIPKIAYGDPARRFAAYRPEKSISGSNSWEEIEEGRVKTTRSVTESEGVGSESSRQQHGNENMSFVGEKMPVKDVDVYEQLDYLEYLDI